MDDDASDSYWDGDSAASYTQSDTICELVKRADLLEEAVEELRLHAQNHNHQSYDGRHDIAQLDMRLLDVENHVQGLGTIQAARQNRQLNDAEYQQMEAAKQDEREGYSAPDRK